MAGFRGALLNPYGVNVATASSLPLTGVKAKLLAQELVQDSHPSVYRYHQTFSGKTRKTVVAVMELQPWSAGTIRAHERTLPMARELATRGITNEAAHTEAVFCGFPDREREVDRVLALIERQQPTLVVTTADGTVHTVWRESDPFVLKRLRDLFESKDLHVLDGNGRYEGMLEYRDSLGPLPAHSTARYGLACLVNISDPALQAVARHRVLRGGTSRAEVLTAAQQFFAYDRIEGAAEDFAKQREALAGLGDDRGFLALFPDDPDAWRLRLLPGISVGGAKIDTVVLENLFIPRVVPGAQARSVVEPSTVTRAVADGAIGLIMRPTALEHALRAEESGELLPFGSTAFLPPLARLVTFLIDPNELLDV